MNLTTFADEVGQWMRDRYPERSDVATRALKLTEEVGEVAAEAIWFRTDATLELANELGDVMICVAGLADAAGLDLEDVTQRRWATVQRRSRRVRAG